MNRETQRLLEEWQQHGKIIIASDFDDTIRPWRFNTQAYCDSVIHLLSECKLVGAYIIIYTACKEERFDEIRAYCKDKGLEIDAINKNPIELPYGNHAKPYANIFLDDRAGLDSTFKTLSEAMYEMRAYNAGKRLDNEGSTEF
jgi:hypothetical protein